MEDALRTQVPVVSPALDPAADEVASARAAFRTLFQTHFSYVFHTLRRLGVAARDLPDVTHDVFVTAYRRFCEYDPSRPLRPWLFGIALRLAADHRRLARHRREVSGAPIEQARDPAPSAEHALQDKQDRALVLEALDAVELDRRAVLVMHDIDGHTMPEIAEALGVPLATAYSRLRLARQDLHAAAKRLRARRGDR